jgi:hypothetical protein
MAIKGSSLVVEEFLMKINSVRLGFRNQVLTSRRERMMVAGGFIPWI